MGFSFKRMSTRGGKAFFFSRAKGERKRKKIFVLPWWVGEWKLLRTFEEGFWAHTPVSIQKLLRSLLYAKILKVFFSFFFFFFFLVIKTAPPLPSPPSGSFIMEYIFIQLITCMSWGQTDGGIRISIQFARATSSRPICGAVLSLHVFVSMHSFLLVLLVLLMPYFSPRTSNFSLCTYPLPFFVHLHVLLILANATANLSCLVRMLKS